MTTAQPLAELDDYVSGVMPDEQAEAFEAALFEAEGLQLAAFFDEFPRLLRFAGRFGPVGRSLTREGVEQVIASGVKVALLEVCPGRRNEIQPWPLDTELVVTRVRVNALGCERIDVDVERLDGRLIKRFNDGGCDPTTGELYAWYEEPLARAGLLGAPFRFRVVGERGGVRHVLGEAEVFPGLARPLP